MNEPAAPVTVALRIPGQWSHPRELVQRLPAGHRLTPEALFLPDGTEGGFGAMTGALDSVEVIRYLARGEKPVDDGDVIADLDGPRFRAVALDSAGDLVGSPLHNPFGRLKLVSMRDIAETN